VGRDERPAWPKGSLQNPQAGPKVMGDLIDSAIRLSRHEAMILGMDVQPWDALAAAVQNGLTIDDIRELVEQYHKNTAILKKAIDVPPQDLIPTLQIEPPAEPEPAVDIASVNGTAHGLTFEE
jgi:hypothetical protein